MRGRDWRAKLAMWMDTAVFVPLLIVCFGAFMLLVAVLLGHRTGEKSRKQMESWHIAGHGPEHEVGPNGCHVGRSKFNKIVRVKTPGGWLVVGDVGDALTYVPDPEHRWEMCVRASSGKKERGGTKE